MTQQNIFRFMGTIEAEHEISTITKAIAVDALEWRFSVTPYKVKVVAKKLTRFQLRRHFIAYFDATQYGKLRQQLDTMRGISHLEHGTERVLFHDTHVLPRLALRYGIHHRVVLDMEPLRVIPQDMGEPIDYDVEAPVTASITPRRNRRRGGATHAVVAKPVTPPSSGTLASAPLRVR